MRAARQNFVKSELHRIRKSFMALAKAFDRLGPALTVSVNRAVTAPVEGETRSGRRKPRLSLEQRQALKLQGKYMGTMRGLKATYQARVKSIRKTKGIRAAIAEAQKLAAR
ncbi:MAG TPA: hypothetical protein VE404_06505 [Verrucomicrobiae bacterium]|nr:hypothetical protein [Verrucomicrobiae bacterium]